MTAYKSVQETNRTAEPVVKLAAHEAGGRVRVLRFEYTTPAGGLAINDTIDLATLTQNGRILGGSVAFEAMGASATAEIGTAASASRYLSAGNVAAAGALDFAHTIALNTGEAVNAGTTLVAKVTGAGWAAAKKFNGYALFVAD
jgi:hypothetical protein